MPKKLIIFIFIPLIFLALFWLLYEPVSVYISTTLTGDYYKTHPLLDSNSKVQSKSYILKKLSNDRGYSGNVKDSIYYDATKQNFVLELYQPERQIIISKNGVISKVDKKSTRQQHSKIQLDVYPQKYYAFEHPWEAEGEPVNIVQYHKRRFEWPSACPYIGIPICNGWMWYGIAFFQVEHKGEFLNFHLDTQYALFDGYDGQVYKLSLPENMNSKIAFINVNQSSNATDRPTGWYVILPKSN